MYVVTKPSTVHHHGNLWVRKLVNSSHDLDKAVIISSFSASLLAISRAENITDKSVFTRLQANTPK